MYAQEPILKPFISNTDIKSFCPIEVTDLRLQVENIHSKKFHLFAEYRDNPDNARLPKIIIRRTKMKTVSDGNKINTIEVF